MKYLKLKIRLSASTMLFVFLFSMSFSVHAQQTTFIQKYGTDTDYKRLYFLNIQYIQSWVRSDTTTYNNLLWADDFVHINSSDGAVIPKKELAPLFGRPRFERLEYFYPENVMIQFITNDAAMIYAKTSLGLVGQQRELSGRYNDVYLKRNGKWICVAANTVAIPFPGTDNPPSGFTKIPEPTKFISFYNGTESDKNSLKELNAKHAEAFARSKNELVENILAEDFILQAANGQLYKKQEVLEQIRSQAKNNNLDTYSIENLGIRFVAADIAMIYAVFVAKRKDGISTATQYNDIYVKRNGSWVCVSGNNAPVIN